MIYLSDDNINFSINLRPFNKNANVLDFKYYLISLNTNTKKEIEVDDITHNINRINDFKMITPIIEFNPGRYILEVYNSTKLIYMKDVLIEGYSTDVNSLDIYNTEIKEFNNE